MQPAGGMFLNDEAVVRPLPFLATLPFGSIVFEKSRLLL
jgi:hypothetical protein